MANLTAASTFDDVYQLESTDQALAGAGGTMNRQAQALLNRTQFLADTKFNTADFSSALKTNLNVTGTAPIYSARTWVCFDGTGTVAIQASGNVSSITDNAVGDYTVNFATAMPDTNYAIAGVTGNADVTAYPAAASIRAQTGAITTTSCRVRTGNHFVNSNPAAYDMPYNSVIIFR